METIGWIYTKGGNFCVSQFALHHANPLLKRDLLSKEFFSYRVDPFSEEDKQFWQNCLPWQFIHSP